MPLALRIDPTRADYFGSASRRSAFEFRFTDGNRFAFPAGSRLTRRGLTLAMLLLGYVAWQLPPKQCQPIHAPSTLRGR